MPDAIVNGIRLDYRMVGQAGAEPVLLVCGTGQPAYSWHLGIATRLVEAGYRVVTFDNRGVAPSDTPPPPYSVADLVADAAALIDHVDLGPCRVAGLSLGALITQELALARPDLVRAAVMMGTVGRSSAMLRGWLEGTLDLIEQGIVLPPRFDAAMLAMQVVGPRHQRDDAFIGPWLELVAAVPPWEGPGRQGQYAADLAYDDRLGALAGVTVPSLVIGFEHDLITPATMCREVADAIPGGRYVEVPECGHLGPFEDPKTVVPLLLEFFAAV